MAPAVSEARRRLLAFPEQPITLFDAVVAVREARLLRTAVWR